jgi:tetratricopeptide (TPR) repeat protein
MARSLVFGFALFMFPTLLIAQGNCRLTVKVVTNNERSTEMAIQVDVLSPEGLIVNTINMFGGNSQSVLVTTGNAYHLRVSGTGIETITTPNFDISPLEADHTEVVHVKLAKPKGTEESTPGAATISVSEMNVPKLATAEMKKGLDAYSKGEIKNAAAHFQKAAVDYPRYARAYDMLGAIAIQKHNRAEARELFSKSLQVDADFYPAYIDLARMDVQDKRYAESESLLAKAIALKPWMPGAIALLATTEFANGEDNKALVDVERAHALPNHEEFAEIHIMAGKVLRKENHPNDAIAQFQLFLKEKPDSPESENIRKEIASIQAEQRH